MIPFLRDLVLRDFWLKFVSVGLASVIWFTVNMMRSDSSAVPALAPGPIETRTFAHLPVVIMSAAETVGAFRVDPHEIEVTVQGVRKVIQNLQPNEIRVRVDMTDIGTTRDHRKRIEVSTPAGVNHVLIDPPEVQVTFPPPS